MRDFVSGGAAASGALLKFLADREAEQRQAMLDGLTQQREERLLKSTDANIANMQANTASLNEQRESQAALRAEQMEAAKVKRAGEVYRPGDVVSDPSSVPADLLQGQTTLPARTMQMEAAPGVVVQSQKLDATPTGKQTFRGTSEQRVAAEEKARMDVLLADANVPDTVKAAVRAGAKPTADMFVAKPDTRTLQIRAEEANKKGDTAEYQRLLNVIKETGRADDKPASNVSVNLGADAVDLAAWQYLQTGTMPPLGMGASNMRGAILERAAALAKQYAINPQSNAAAYRADQGALTQITRSQAAITAFKETTRKNIDVLKGTLQQIPDLGASILNRPVRALMRMTGSPEMARFQTALGAVQPEVARILTNPNLTGVLSDSARHEVQELLRGDYTVQQILAAIGVLEQDMTNRSTALDAERRQLEESIRLRGPAGAAQPSGSASPTETPEQRAKRLYDSLTQPKQ